MARNGPEGRLAQSAGTPNHTREPARAGKKKPQPRTVGVSLLVVGRQPVPNRVEKTCYRRSGKLISAAGCCEKRGVDRL